MQKRPVQVSRRSDKRTHLKPVSRPSALLALAVMVPLDSASARPLFRQVYDGLRDAILSQRCPPGARLPSTRGLAKEPGVSRSSITVAFEQLRAEGYVDGHRGGGTRVRDAIPDLMLNVGMPDGLRRTTLAARKHQLPADRELPILSHRGTLLAAAGAALIGRAGTPPVPFRLGTPASDAFPDRVWARISARHWRARALHRLDANPAGELPLREAIATYLVNARGARCSSEQTIRVLGRICG